VSIHYARAKTAKLAFPFSVSQAGASATLGSCPCLKTMQACKFSFYFLRGGM
jgi:hypothetical protein